MKTKTEETLIITLAIIIFIAIYITINPSITGLVILSNFTNNDNIIINGTIQLKQYNLTQTSTTEEILYYALIFAEENTKNKIVEISQKDDKFVELDSIDIFKIKFDSTLEDQDKLNAYLANTISRTLQFCDFNTNTTCENQTIYATFEYPGIDGYYQITLNLPSQTDQLAIYSPDGKVKFDYINASHLEITENSNTTYYYIPSEIESEVIQPENLSKWDLFISNHILNNQSIIFYYKTNQDYVEFTPPYNFSETNSSTLQFKIFLDSDNSSTPVIYNLSISYIGTQETNGTEPENQTVPEDSPQILSASTSGSAPSSRSGTSKMIIKQEPQKTETTAVAQKIELKTAPEVSEQEVIETNFEKELNKPKAVMNAVTVSYLLFMCLLLYKRRHKL